MQSSGYFRKTIYYEQSPTALDYWQARVHSLFVTEESQSWVDAYSNTPFETSVPVDSSDGPARTSISKAQTNIRRHNGSLRHITAVEQASQPRIVFSNDEPTGRQDVAQRGLRLHKLQDTPELLQFLSTSRDRFRLFIIRQRNSFSRLNITESFFDFLTSECHIFPQFREFVLCFGARSGENEVGPPQLRYRVSDRHSSRDSEVRFECAYVLRFVELNHRQNERDPWSLRQSAIYHQYTANADSSIWLFISLSIRAQARIDTYIQVSGDIQQFNPFEVHLLLLDTAMANWRPYLVHMTTEINQQADRVVMASVESNAPIRITEFEERQQLKQVEDKILDLLIIMDSTLDTIDSLTRVHQEVWSAAATQNPERRLPENDLVSFGLAEKRRDILLYRSKVEALRSKVKSTTKLVSSLLDLGNGHSLKVLAEETRAENVAMRRLTEKATQDAAAVKVLTIMTLVYLPMTVVSNFFSTQFVNQVTSADNKVHLAVTSNWWIFLAASLPLTVITLYAWWFYVQKQAYGAYPPWWTNSTTTLRAAFVRLKEQLQTGQRPAPRIHDQTIQS